MVADKRVREAVGITINRIDIAKSVALGNADPAYSIVDATALDFDINDAILQSNKPKRACPFAAIKVILRLGPIFFLQCITTNCSCSPSAASA